MPKKQPNVEPIEIGRSKISDEALSARDESSWVTRSIIVLITLAAIYAAATLWAAHNAWPVTLGAVSWYDILIVISLVSVGLLIRAARWHYYLHVLDWHIPLRPSFVAFVASIALTATPGKAGELVKFVLLRSRFPISLTKGSGILLIERLGDLFAVIALAIGGLTLFVDLSSYVLASVIVVGAVVFVAAKSRVMLVRAQAIPKLRALSLKLMNMLDAVQLLLRPLPLVIGGSLALTAWSCEALAFHFLIGRLGIHCSLLISFSIYGLSTLAGALSMLPGGIGGVEVVMVFLLTRLATPASVATVAVVIFRLCTLWLFSLIGVVFMFAWMIFMSKRRHRGREADVS